MSSSMESPNSAKESPNSAEESPNSAEESPNTRTSTTHDPFADFFRAELALSCTLANMAETNFRIGHQESAESALRKAQVGCATVRRFLDSPRHAKHLTGEERRKTTEAWEGLQYRLAQLDRDIAHKPLHNDVPAQKPDAQAH